MEHVQIFLDKLESETVEHQSVLDYLDADSIKSMQEILSLRMEMYLKRKIDDIVGVDNPDYTITRESFNILFKPVQTIISKQLLKDILVNKSKELKHSIEPLEFIIEKLNQSIEQDKKMKELEAEIYDFIRSE